MNWNNDINAAPFNQTILGLFEYPSGGREVRVLQRIAKHTLEAEPDCQYYDYEGDTDKYYCKEGWYEQANDFDDMGWWWISPIRLTHWAEMELPEREHGE